VALFQLEGSSNEESEFERVRISENWCGYSKPVRNNIRIGCCVSCYKEHHPIAYWLPQLFLHSGARRTTFLTTSPSNIKSETLYTCAYLNFPGRYQEEDPHWRFEWHSSPHKSKLFKCMAELTVSLI
jgi:hypothetical protein